jgi:FkbM family methyltransferase
MVKLIRWLGYRLRTRPLLGRWALRLIPDLPWTTRVQGLGRFRIRLRRNRSWWLRDPLVTESFPFAMLRQLVRPGDVVYDVGANLGLYARYLVGLGAGQVFAFEPMAALDPLLAVNLALGDPSQTGSRVTILAVALADADGDAEFQLDDVQSTSGTLSRVTGGGPCLGRKNLGLAPLTTEVACRSLDSLAAAGLPKPAVIKIDVEGAEALVLAGAAALLRANAPRLLIELHGAEMAHAVLPMLDGLGYACVAKTAPHIHPSGFGRVDPSVLPKVSGPYDIHFLVACRSAAELPGWEPA